MERPAGELGGPERPDPGPKIATTYSSGGATKDESDQDAIMAHGHVAAILGNGWEVGSVIDPKTGDPSLKRQAVDLPAAGHLGRASSRRRSSVAPTSRCRRRPRTAGLGAEWIKIYTDTESQTALAKFAIPNTTSLLSVYEAARLRPTSRRVRRRRSTWFVPNTPNWANVETGNVLQNMLESIATGKSTIPDATKSADGQIANNAERG